MEHRNPKHTSTASTSTPEARHATAVELRHVADLVEAGKLELRNGNEVGLADGWDRVTFDRKLDPSLSAS